MRHTTGRAAHGLGVFSEKTMAGCSAAPAGSGAESRTVAPANSTHYEPPAFRNAEFHPDAAVSGSGAEIDLSAVSQGYVAVRAQSDKRLKCQVVYGDVKYNYDLPGDGTPVVYPLQSGNGQYNVRVMQNTTENKYMELFSAQADAVLDSEFEPFLRPSQRSLQCGLRMCLAGVGHKRTGSGCGGGGEQCVRIYPRQCGL